MFFFEKSVLDACLYGQVNMVNGLRPYLQHWPACQWSITAWLRSFKQTDFQSTYVLIMPYMCINIALTELPAWVKKIWSNVSSGPKSYSMPNMLYALANI